VAVAASRAVVSHWIPVGDNAYLALRAGDVFSRHVPLLGTGSSASETAGRLLNHPGPLYFDALALPVRFLGDGAGTAVGVAIINSVAIIGTVVFVRRRVGPLLATVAALATTTLCFTMGSEVLFDPWQPYAVILPFLFFLVLVWSVTRGDLVAVPWGVAVGSLVLQTHLSYALLVPALSAWAVLGLFVDLRDRRCREPQSWPELRQRVQKVGAIACALFALCWAQPIVEQFTGEGTGNLSRLVQGAGDPASATAGYGRGLRVVASVVGLPPWWFRPSLGNAWRGLTERLPSSDLAIVSLAITAAVLGWCVWIARRHGNRDGFTAVVTAGVGLAAGMVTAQLVPVGPLGLAGHHFFWLWPLSAFTFFAVAAIAVPRVARARLGRTMLVPGLIVLIVVIAAVNLIPSNQGSIFEQPEWSVRGARELQQRMAALEGSGPLLVDGVIIGFADPYGPAVIAELRRRRIPFVVESPGLLRHLGSDRRFTGQNADAALVLKRGEPAKLPLAGARRVVLSDGLSGVETRELSRLREQIVTYLRDTPFRLTPRGREALQRGELPELRSASPVDPDAVFQSRVLVRLVRDDLIVLDPNWTARFNRYAELQTRFDNETLALFLRPLG
jgi:hypothetical protein